jgi:hypothetical protein
VDSDSDSEEDQSPGGDTKTKPAANVEHVSPLFSSDSDSEADLPDGRKENCVPDGDTGPKPAANAKTVEEHRKEAANVFWTCCMKQLLSNLEKK